MNNPDVDHFYFNGAHYDAKIYHVQEEIPFWIQQTKKYGDPVLELAVGTGRIAIPIAKAGYRITGIDMSDSMLEQAQKKIAEESVDLDLIKADIRDFQLNTKFPLIIIPANTIVHFQHIEDLDACLTCVKQHLTPDGRLILDTHNPQFKYLNNEPSAPSTRTYSDPNGKGDVTITSQNHYDMATQINQMTMTYNLPNGDEIVDEVNARIYFPLELEAILKYNGFTLEKKYGNYDGESFHSESAKQILISRQT